MRGDNQFFGKIVRLVDRAIFTGLCCKMVSSVCAALGQLTKGMATAARSQSGDFFAGRMGYDGEGILA